MNKASPKKILVVEDDVSLKKLLVNLLGNFGYEVVSALTGKEAEVCLETADPDLVLMDMRLPDCNGLDLLVKILPHAPVITMTAFGTVDQAVKAVRSGASDYLVKPISSETLELAIERVFQTSELKRDVAYWQAQAQRVTNSAIIGDSPELNEMRSLIDLYAEAGPTILVEGESGTGKELVARSIHDASDRAGGRFIPIDCDPSQENAIAAELFGQEQNSFPGGGARQEGMLDFADQGTIYISDIAEISQALQSKILRVLETGKYRRRGGSEDIATNARIIFATRHDLHELVQKGHFRSELFFRLSPFRISVPPLRDRQTDVILLARYFLQARSFQRGVDKVLAADTLDALEQYGWPGNVRELRNAIERGVIVSGTSPEILPHHVLFEPSMRAGSEDMDEDDDMSVVLRFSEAPTLDDLRTSYMQFLLDRNDGNRRKVAGILGISERNTYRLIPRLKPKTPSEDD